MGRGWTNSPSKNSCNDSAERNKNIFFVTFSKYFMAIIHTARTPRTDVRDLLENTAEETTPRKFSEMQA